MKAPGFFVLDVAQHRLQVLHADRVALLLDDLDALFLERLLQRGGLLQAEELVDVDHRRGGGAARLQELGERVHHHVGLLQQREEVRVLQPSSFRPVAVGESIG
jgi:hypothetical protein